ncbi:MAG: hypothetical protein NWQ21_11170, partial [Desulfobacterales bacterium]|nr:hypothetical protein [Desulfobacterales bacterium]
KIIPPLACLMARLLRYIHPHVSRYAQVDVPCRQTIIRRNRVELFLTVTLKSHGVSVTNCRPTLKSAAIQQGVEKRHELRQDKAKSDEKAEFMIDK